MESTTATPSAAATTSAPAVIDTPQPALPRPVFLTALIVAVALPVILLILLVIVMIATQYNFLNWME